MQTEQKYISAPEKAGMDMSVSEESCMSQTAVLTAEMAVRAEMSYLKWIKV